MGDRATAAPGSAGAGGRIPLDLVPLLKAHGRKKHRLLIRVMKLPHLARFSRGSRNEDGTWSLTADDLLGLELLLPDDTAPPSSLSVRLIGIDENETASIVAQLSVPLPSVEAAAKASANDSAESAAEPPVAAPPPSNALNADVDWAAAEAELRAEHEKRLSEQTKALEEEWRKKLETERSVREAAEASAEDARQKLTALSGELDAARARAAAAETKLASHKDDGQRVAQESKAHSAKELEQRLAAARADWEKESEARAAAALKQAAKDSAAALQKAANDSAAARKQAERDSEARIGAAVKQTVKDTEAAADKRLAEAQAKWQAEADRKIAAARALSVEAESAAQRMRAERTEAEARWKADSETRLAEQARTLEQEWREKLQAEQTARETAEAKAQESARKLGEQSLEREVLSTRLAAAEAKAAEHGSAEERDEKEIAARAAEQVKERVAVSKVLWEQESEERTAAAVKKAEEKARAAAEARFQQERKRWEEESLQSFVDAEERWREEGADRLAAARAQWEQTARPVERESAWDPLATMERDPFAAPEEEIRPVDKRPKNRAWRRVQNAVLLAGCLAAVFLVYPVLKQPLVEEWLPKIEAFVADSGLLSPTGPRSPPSAERPRMTVATNAANLRAGPSTASQVVATLGRNTSVTVLERRGAWLLVEVADDRTIQGWLHDSLVRTAAER